MTTRTSQAPVSELRWAIRDAIVLTKRSLQHIPRIPELLVFATIQPVMFVLLFRYVFGGAIDVGGTSYVNFLMAGIFVQTVSFGSMTTAISLSEDMQRGLVDRFRSLPMSRSAVLVGRIAADVVRNTFVVIVMLIVGLLVGFRPEGSPLEWLVAGALLLMVSFAFSWIASTIALWVKSPEAVQSAGFIWLFPLTFASSAFVETSTMPGWLQGFANNQPITQIVNAVRALVLDLPANGAVWKGFAWCIGILAAFMPLAVSLYRRSSD